MCRFHLLREFSNELPWVRAVLQEAEAERKLEEKARRLAEKKYASNLSDEAKTSIQNLEQAEKYLHQKSDLYLDLSQSAKKKRVYDRSNPAYKWVALAITIMGAGAFVYGIYSLVTHAGFIFAP